MPVDILSYNKNSDVGLDLTDISAKTATKDAAIAPNARANFGRLTLRQGCSFGHQIESFWDTLLLRLLSFMMKINIFWGSPTDNAA